MVVILINGHIGWLNPGGANYLEKLHITNALAELKIQKITPRKRNIIKKE